MFLNFHTHIRSKNKNSINIYNVIVNKDSINDASWHEMESVSLGIHPWYISNDETSIYLDYIRENAGKPNVKLIGEAGLDKVKGVDFETQMEVFLQQILIAEEVRKPIVIHCVRAFKEILDIKKSRNSNVAMVLHGFVKKTSVANELVKHGCKLSFGKDLIYKQHVIETFRATSLDSVFLETDDCEDLDIEMLYEKAAEIKGLSLEDLKEKIYQNFLELYL